MQAASLFALGAYGPPGAAQATPRPLPIPPLLEPRPGAALELSAQPGETEFLAGRASATAGYNGGYLGPTLRLARGSDVRFHVRNRLAENTTVHWHGLLVPSEVDGGPHNDIAPGGEWRPTVPVRQRAATCWYHAHPHMRTGPQVYSGLAGMLIVTDDEERALGLPSEYGVDDLPVILQDRMFDREGRMVYPRMPMMVMHGVHGNTFLVNGAVGPQARVPARLVRLRLLNAANARTFELAFSDERAFWWIATDGGLLEKPVNLRRLALAPAQRAELLVDFSDGAEVALQMRAPRGAHPLLRFAPEGARGRAPRIPATLARADWPAASRAGERRSFTLNMGMPAMGGGMGGMHGGMGGGAGGMPMMGSMRIDGRAFDMARIDHRVRLGGVEVWRVASQPAAMMDVPHPFHVHGVHFTVLSRDGRPPGPEDQGVRDTVLVDEPVELLVHFTQPASEDKPFMYHCHILEHEDAGMMGQFTVG